MPAKAVFSSADEALADLRDGAVIMVAGYAVPGTPQNLVKAILKKDVGGLTCISGPWYGTGPNIYDAAMLVASGRVKRAITAPPIHHEPWQPALQLQQQGRLELEIVPQGTLVERIRAGGAGLGGLLLPSSRGPAYEGVREVQVIDGEEFVLEMPIRADYALLRAHLADSLGNLVYRRSQRNWNPIMGMSADVTIAEVDAVVQPGELDPELVVTPGIYVDRIVAVGELSYARPD